MEPLSSLSTMAETLPQVLENAVASVTIYIPQDVSSVIKHAYTYLPSEMDIRSAAMFIVYFGFAALILGVIGRLVLGKRSSLNHSLSSAMGIAFVYAAAIVVYTFQPWDLEFFRSPLPFITFAGDYLIVLPISDILFSALCTEVLSLVILAFLVNLLDSLFPRGKSVIGWYLLRLLTVVAALGLHLVISWCFHTYFPEVLVTHAPTILLFLLAFFLLSGLVSLILGGLIAISNPFLGAMYTFFFSNLVGKQVSKAIFTSGIVLCVVYLLEYAGYTVITITSAALMAYLPLVVILLFLWYLIGHVL